MQREKSPHLLLLDAGNALHGRSGPALTNQGKDIVEAMNMMGYDALTLGGIDLMLGPETLRQRMAEAKFPFLSANLTLAESGELLAQPYLIKEIAGHRVGIIGLTSTASPMPTTPEKVFAVEDPLEAAKRYVKEVAAQADIVILLTHLGLPLDQTIGQKVPGVDIIVGGQSRTLVRPTRNNDKGPVIAQAGYRGEWIGLLQAEFDGKGNITSFQGDSVELTDKYSDDPAMRQFVDRIKARP